MKMFNVHLQVNMTEIGDPDKIKPQSELPALTEGFSSDSPIKDVAILVERLQQRGMFPGGIGVPSQLIFPGGDNAEGMSMRHDFQVVIGSFEEMQQVLAKFRAVCESLTMPVDAPKS